MFQRMLDLKKFNQSLFLFGPRQVGKTFLIQQTLTPNVFINLLEHEEFTKYSRDVSLLSKEIEAMRLDNGLVVIDEIQRCPELLNEVQLIMGKKPAIQFILTGSSARKLRRAGVNLLGGRAITLHLHPLTSLELQNDFSLEKILAFGAIPNIVLEQNEDNKTRLLRGYVELYLKEEIQQESLTRNIPAFSKFLDLAAHENGGILNFQSLAKEVGVHSKTIKEYFNILEDTLLGFRLTPYTKSQRKKIISHPKFYLFDRGVVNALRGEINNKLLPGTASFGRAFEHFIVLEIYRVLDYRERNAKLSFFRTSDGAEVDLILEMDKKTMAIEIKSGAAPSLSEMRGLRSFMKDHVYDRALCVCQTTRPYINEGIEFLHWQEFLKQI